MLLNSKGESNPSYAISLTRFLLPCSLCSLAPLHTCSSAGTDPCHIPRTSTLTAKKQRRRPCWSELSPRISTASGPVRKPSSSAAARATTMRQRRATRPRRRRASRPAPCSPASSRPAPSSRASAAYGGEYGDLSGFLRSRTTGQVEKYAQTRQKRPVRIVSAWLPSTC